MSRIREIRERLKLTQSDLAEKLGCTQGNVGHYERGQLMRPKRANALIAIAAKQGLHLTLEHIYGTEPLPAEADKSPA
jgi:putative transcriptional regulator